MYADGLNESWGCRLYKYDSGSLSRIALTDDNLAHAADTTHDDDWSTMVDPSATASLRDTTAASLFGLPTQGEQRPCASQARAQYCHNGICCWLGI